VAKTGQQILFSPLPESL